LVAFFGKNFSRNGGVVFQLDRVSACRLQAAYRHDQWKKTPAKHDLTVMKGGGFDKRP
jgi:hypothetical protein